MERCVVVGGGYDAKKKKKKKKLVVFGTIPDFHSVQMGGGAGVGSCYGDMVGGRVSQLEQASTCPFNREK